MQLQVEIVYDYADLPLITVCSHNQVRWRYVNGNSLLYTVICVSCQE